jgi:glycosyltransferase involved in cell wall biosynthesis
MNKTMEYMAFGMPVVAFDLKETRVSAAGAGCYVPSGDVRAYAEAIVELLDDADKRADMGRKGRLRIENELGWPHQRDAYVFVYDRLVGRARTTVRYLRPRVRG